MQGQDSDESLTSDRPSDSRPSDSRRSPMTADNRLHPSAPAPAFNLYGGHPGAHNATSNASRLLPHKNLSTSDLGPLKHSDPPARASATSSSEVPHLFPPALHLPDPDSPSVRTSTPSLPTFRGGVNLSTMTLPSASGSPSASVPHSPAHQPSFTGAGNHRASGTGTPSDSVSPSKAAAFATYKQQGSFRQRRGSLPVQLQEAAAATASAAILLAAAGGSGMQGPGSPAGGGRPPAFAFRNPSSVSMGGSPSREATPPAASPEGATFASA